MNEHYWYVSISHPRCQGVYITPAPATDPETRIEIAQFLEANNIDPYECSIFATIFKGDEEVPADEFRGRLLSLKELETIFPDEVYVIPVSDACGRDGGHVKVVNGVMVPDPEVVQ